MRAIRYFIDLRIRSFNELTSIAVFKISIRIILEFVGIIDQRIENTAAFELKGMFEKIFNS